MIPFSSHPSFSLLLRFTRSLAANYGGGENSDALPAPEALRSYGLWALALLKGTLAISSPDYPLDSVCQDLASKVISTAPGVLFTPPTVTCLCVSMYNASVRLAYCAGNDKKKMGETVRACAASIVEFTDEEFRESMGKEVLAAASGGGQNGVREAIGEFGVVAQIWETMR